MFKIVKREEMSDGTVVLNDIEAPKIAQKAKPGQFVILKANEDGERIPLTMADTDPDKGTLTVIYMVVGKSTALFKTLKVGMVRYGLMLREDGMAMDDGTKFHERIGSSVRRVIQGEQADELSRRMSRLARNADDRRWTNREAGNQVDFRWRPPVSAPCGWVAV